MIMESGVTVYAVVPCPRIFPKRYLAVRNKCVSDYGSGTIPGQSVKDIQRRSPDRDRYRIGIVQQQ